MDRWRGTSPGVRHLHNCKHTAWAAAKRTNDALMWSKFKYLRNKLKIMLREERHNFMYDLALSLKNNAKRFWTFFQRKTKTKSLPETIIHESQECSSPRKKANLFNKYFQSVFPVEETPAILSSQNISSTDTNFKPALSLIDFEKEKIAKMLQEVNVNKACGPDNLSSHVLKECAVELAPSLACLFKRSFNSGCIPAQWKQGNVVPVHKKGDKSHVSNYRPISLLCIVSKIMEKYIYNQIIDSVKPLIHPLPHGSLRECW